jgi:transcriptional regulator with XRE-family HTH domain
MKKLIEQLKIDLANRRSDWAKLAKYSGLSYSWIAKLENGTCKNPTVDSIERIQQALDNI